MTQLSLFDDDPPALARSSDPHTSHSAAAEVTASGAAARQRQRVLAVLAAHPGLCSDEIAEVAGMERHQPARRTSELERMGLIRRGPARVSRVGRRAGVTWFRVSAEVA
jgi:DNA-binding MarR family transcriptional regulator